MGQMIALAALLRAEVERGSRRLRRIDEDESSRTRGEGKWVRKEILGHLIDSAADNHERFVRAQFAEPFSWPGYDQEAWVVVHRYRERPWRELVDLWVALNWQVAAVIEAVPTSRLGIACQVGGGEAAPLEWWTRDYLRHLKHHLAQIDVG